MTEDQELAQSLNARFADLLGEHADVGAELVRRYAEPQRHYHDQRHLAHVLDRVEEFATAKHDRFLVSLAAWFHDAVYAIPTAELSNEEASARLAIRTLGRCGFEQEEIGEVARLVRLTETHRPLGSDADGELLCDADLAILAAEPEDYRRYVADVRAEYPKLDDQEFARGRLAVLQRFGGRDIFRTSKGRRLNAAARTNLTTEALQLIDDLGVRADFDPDEWPLNAG
ncbi:HD domain-containing protein [Microlunatus soli]|uniref:Predicted metal-dependent phosphohydrolase, HD superfamily n=1 Tax=Microlunatus soli TaxID=630515 RepID=A0A1H1T073_9ACTN|nr:metal-dependent phosphohydrolase [Microlunatus soli]SDS53632.1 Predicted metal-dependent phosphohydrolase, HD superfamily [Microlunatus soli]